MDNKNRLDFTELPEDQFLPLINTLISVFDFFEKAGYSLTLKVKEKKDATHNNI